MWGIIGAKSFSSWPIVDKKFIDDHLETQGDYCIRVTNQARQFKTQNQKHLKEEIRVSLPLMYQELFKKEASFLPDLKAVIKAKEITFERKEISFSL